MGLDDTDSVSILSTWWPHWGMPLHVVIEVLCPFLAHRIRLDALVWIQHIVVHLRNETGLMVLSMVCRRL